LDELEAGSRPQEKLAALSALKAAEAQAARAQVEYDRLIKLREKDQAADLEFQIAKFALDAAKAEAGRADANYKLVEEGPRKETIEQARAALAEAQQRLDMAVNGPRVETIDQARARVGQAQAALRAARTRLGYASLASPMSGVVLSKNVEPGEYVAPGTPIVTVADLTHIWLRAYINETDLEKVKLGQKVRVTTDALPRREYVGRVAFISSQAEFTPKTVQTAQERVKLVYRIKIDIENPKQELKPGMPADAEILIGE